MDPRQEEFNAKATRNMRVEGYGLETAQVFPCPGCAEPDWQRVRIIQAEVDLSKGATCRHCQRSFRVLVQLLPGQTRFEFVQTGGPDLPDWYEPKMRRIGERAG